ncbi:MAG: LysR family transcriptional regulator [Oceanospirillaceae bacterium]|nr:LysR family transcriptional regulator [Oceanospirillaceae bacterium]
MRSLNFHHLYYFWTVAKEGHLTRAAQQLHVSQSALSSQIRQLEDQLGHRLFDREGRRLELTTVGQRVLEYAENIFGLGSELLAMLESGEHQRVQRLRIGAVTTLSRNFQDNFLRPVLGSPDVQLVVESATLDELLERLRVHKLDLILSNKAVATDAGTPWRCRRIAQQSACLVGPPEGADRFRYPQDLEKVLLLVPGPGSDLRSQFDLLCEQEGLNISYHAEVEDMAMLRLLARDSGGIAVVPEVVVQDELQQGVLRNYRSLPTVTENFYAIMAKRQFAPKALDNLVEIASQG